jgi:hypothetical protein
VCFEGMPLLSIDTAANISPKFLFWLNTCYWRHRENTAGAGRVTGYSWVGSTFEVVVISLSVQVARSRSKLWKL